MFQLLEVAAEGFVCDVPQVALHFIEPHRLIPHQAIQNHHLVFAADKRHGIAEAGIRKVCIADVFPAAFHGFTLPFKIVPVFIDSTCVFPDVC